MFSFRQIIWHLYAVTAIYVRIQLLQRITVLNVVLSLS